VASAQVADDGQCTSCNKPRSIGLICAVHNKLLNQWLREIPLMYALLDEFLLDSPAQNSNTRHATPTGSRPPARLEVLSLRDHRANIPTQAGDIPSVVGVLNSWASVVRQDRQLAKPTKQATVVGEANLLLVHQEWITAQPFVGDLVAELRSVRNSLMYVTGEPY